MLQYTKSLRLIASTTSSRGTFLSNRTLILTNERLYLVCATLSSLVENPQKASFAFPFIETFDIIGHLRGGNRARNQEAARNTRCPGRRTLLRRVILSRSSRSFPSYVLSPGTMRRFSFQLPSSCLYNRRRLATQCAFSLIALPCSLKAR